MVRVLPSAAVSLLTVTAAADRKLLLGILKMQNVSVDYDAIAEYMTTEDQICTASAINNRVKKLKNLAKEGYVLRQLHCVTSADRSLRRSTGSDDGTPKPKATPKSKGTPNKRGKAGKDGDDDESPSKKAKTSKGGKGNAAGGKDAGDEEANDEAGVKQEDGDEEDLLD